MKFQSQKGKMNQRKHALWDSSLEPTGKKKKKKNMQEKAPSTKWEKPTKSTIRKSLQKIRGNWGTFLFVWRFLGFATFCCLRGIQAHNNGKTAWQRPEIQIGQEMETAKIHRLKSLTAKDSCFCCLLIRICTWAWLL